MILVEILFFISLTMTLYIYFGYPGLLCLYTMIEKKKVIVGPFLPSVSILIAAYNEEDIIEATVRNKLLLDYPGDKFEIIVISDASDDHTDDIIKKYSYKDIRVKLIRQEPRAGKTAALNKGLRHATGEIIVFSDANSIYQSDALKSLVQNFYDPAVGYVTGKMTYIMSSSIAVGSGCSAYMKYENFLRSHETRLGSIVGVNGGIDAVRKSLYRPMQPDQLPDFVLPLKVVEQGYRVVYEPGALLQEASSISSNDEYKMRVRVSLRSLWALKNMKSLFNPIKYGLFAWELLSHKALRYLGFVFLFGLYVSNLLLWHKGFSFQVLFVLQTIFYISASLAFSLEQRGRSSGVLYIPYFFSLINLACAHAFLRFLFGQKQVIWTARAG